MTLTGFYELINVVKMRLSKQMTLNARHFLQRVRLFGVSFDIKSISKMSDVP